MIKVTVSRQKRGLGYESAAKLVRRAAKAALRAENVNVPCIVNVLLTDDEGIHEINLEQRGVDRPTDVLSFPMNELVPGAFDASRCEYDLDTDMLLLGDMVVSMQRCESQAEEYGHSFEREISYLTVHSMLHLVGYDHLDEGAMKRQMREREDAIMASMGL